LRGAGARRAGRPGAAPSGGCAAGAARKSAPSQRILRMVCLRSASKHLLRNYPLMLRLSCARPRPALTGSLAAAAIALFVWPCLAHSRSAGTPLPHLGPGGTRGPSALVFSGDGKTLYVAEQDEGV